MELFGVRPSRKIGSPFSQMAFLSAYICGPVTAAHLPIVLALLLAGLGGSVTHCLAMCSGFVLGQTPGGKSVLARLLLPYHAGRIATYCALGAAAAAGFGIFSGNIFSLLRHGLLAVVAVLFLAIFAERILSRFGARLPLRLPAAGCALSAMRRLASVRDPLQRFALGASLGLLPCPLVFAAALGAATTGNAWAGALGMLAFGTGTAPALLGVAFAKQRFLNASPRLQDGLTLAALGLNSAILLTLAVR